MTTPVQSPTWTSSSSTPSSHGRSLTQISLPLLHALTSNNLSAAARLAHPITLSPDLLSPSCQSVWARRLRQIEAAPADAPWVTRLLVQEAAAVGRAGFHGPPDERGMVEVGYEVCADHRRQGHARAAMLIMMGVAVEEPAVKVIRATFTPDNAASRALIESFGFVHTGEQMDDEDGLELIYETSKEDMKKQLTKWSL